MRDVIEFLEEIQPHLVTVLFVLVSLWASGHAVLYKRDSRAAVAWVGLIWLSPFFGAIFYYAFGINRIRRRAAALMSERGSPGKAGATGHSAVDGDVDLERLKPRLRSLVAFVDRVVGVPLTVGNAVETLENGDGAYPAMLAAIDGAERSITFSTYIFDRDEAGERFRAALERAVKRGVDVRVLLDDVGARYSFPTVVRGLERSGVRVARFLPTLLPLRIPHINLRNHRKILVADGRTGFTGGMNIRAGNLLASRPRRPIRDLHFRIEGPVVGQLQGVFAEDWAFTTGEFLSGERWFPPLESSGNVLARGISEGPDEDFEKMRWTILGALSSATSRVRIVTPYFLPDSTLITALNVAALSGVRVEIVLPSDNNLPFVHWASCSLLWQVLQHGCHVYFSPPPFDHSKLMIVDEAWALLGSTNWDPRSLRLNFEFNVECHDDELASRLSRVIDLKLEGAREVTLEEMDGRSLPVKMRDGIARLASPYL